MKNMWVVREKDSSLKLFDKMPKYDDEHKFWMSGPAYSNYINLDSTLFPNVTFETSPIRIKVSSNDTELVCSKNNFSISELINELNNTTNIEKAFALSRNLIGKCFTINNPNYKSVKYIKIYDTFKNSNAYIICKTNIAYKAGGVGTWDYNDKYIFKCKDDSEFVIWSDGTHGPEIKYENYDIKEISNEAFIKGLNDLFDEYLENNVL